MAVITSAGESLIVSKIQSAQALNVDQVIFAYIAGINPGDAVDRNQGKPAVGDIKGTLPVTSKSKVNDSTVVFSVSMPSDVGTWKFNWIGLYSSADDTVLAISYVPEQEKRATVGEVLGNVLTKNFAMEFAGAAAVTGATIDVQSWQIDYTSRLREMDNLQRAAIKSIYGYATFEGQGFKVKYSTSQYWLSAGRAIMGGLGFELASDLQITPDALPKTIWLDVYQVQTMVGIENQFDVVANDGTTLADYTAADGMQHNYIKLAVVTSPANITDQRAIVVDDLSVMAMATETSRGLSMLASAINAKNGIGSGVITAEILQQCASIFSDAGTLVKRDVNGDFFANWITATLNGNASTASKLKTAITVGGVPFDGSASINLPGVNAAGNQSTTGNAATATKFATAITIGGVLFDGSTSISLPGVNVAGNQNTTGNAATATKLSTARTIGGVLFDGSANINLPGVNAIGNQDTTGNANSANHLKTPITLQLIGGITGSALFDGSGNTAIPTTINASGLPEATTATKGAVVLSTLTNDTSTSKAATPSAVKQAFDLAYLANGKHAYLSGVTDKEIARANIGIYAGCFDSQRNWIKAPYGPGWSLSTYGTYGRVRINHPFGTALVRVTGTAVSGFDGGNIIFTVFRTGNGYVDIITGHDSGGDDFFTVNFTAIVD